MALPRWLFVQEKKDNDGSTWLHATREQGDSVEDDGTTQTVGTYQLVKKLRMKKEIQIQFGKKR